ncbi:MAG: exosortase-associated EpsI family protein [Phycisphaerales bacterium]
MNRVHEIGPFLAIALILMLPLGFPAGSANDAAAEVHNAQIREAFTEVAWQIARWRGDVVPLPASTDATLNPNAILSRRYREIGTGIEATLVVVHCGDARDILGHWPPVCYPANGFQLTGQQALTVECDIGLADEFTVNRFDFYRPREWGDTLDVNVFNFFVKPDGSTTADYQSITNLAGSAGRSAMGIAQVQIVITHAMSAAEETRTLTQLLSGIKPLLLRLGKYE